MNGNDQDTLRRFHRALVRAIQETNPEHLMSPFTVAEIYQNLVPYRTHRDELDLEMNADYEHALLRLLAGEGEFLTIESGTARQEIRDELDSPNPNTGLYRDFAAADVRLNPEKVDEALQEVAVGEVEGGEGALWEEESTGPSASAPAEEEMEEEKEVDSAEAPPEVSVHGAPADLELEETRAQAGVEEAASEDLSPEVGEGSEESEKDVPDACPWCREHLPDRPNITFCPFCGSKVRTFPCPECGEELELEWRFCIACGTEVSS